MTTRDLHRQAMEYADQADTSKRHGEESDARTLFQRAFELEAAAANELIDQLDAEPSRSVLYRSAATLAFMSGQPREAERLICLALIGNPPSEIAEELRDLLDQINAERHHKVHDNAAFPVVALTVDRPDEHLQKGQVGTIVEVLAPDVFEVEFSDDQGRTYAMTPLPADQLLVLHYEPIVST